MIIDKADLSLRKAGTRKGMIMTCDSGGAVVIAKGAPSSDLAEIRKRLDALGKKIAAAAALARRS